ncbi:MAG: hypothetical protein WCT25_02500 [Candidatus Paceibacterota bacterium]
MILAISTATVGFLAVVALILVCLAVKIWRRMGLVGIIIWLGICSAYLLGALWFIVAWPFACFRKDKSIATAHK